MSEQPPVEIGRIGRAHGVRGDLSVDLITDRVERLAVGAQVRAGERWLTVAAARRAGQRWLVHFDGIDDRTVAEGVASRPLFAAPLAERGDGWYVDQLIGAEVVTKGGEAVGPCVAVIDNPAHDLLELESGALVPIVFVTAFSGGVITIDPPDGLFDL